MAITNKKSAGWRKRKRRVGAKVVGTERPRLCVFRSNKEIYGQIIDDAKQKTIISFSSKKLTNKEKEKKGKEAIAFLVGEKIAILAKKKKIKKVVFDRSGYKYHGRIKMLAEGARKGGLEF